MDVQSDLIARAARGDRAAREALASAYHPVARRTAIGLLGDPHAAEDVAQEAMVRLDASLPGFRGDADLATWVHRVALNLSYDYLRRTRRRGPEVPVAVAATTPDPGIADPHGAIDMERASTAVREALDRLPPEQREVLVLRFLSDLSYAEIARVTGAAEGTVASRIYRALKRLGSDLEPKHLEVVR